MNLVDRIARRLTGRPYATLAATVIVARGEALLDQESLAEQIGVPTKHVQSWESGTRSPGHLPRRIRTFAPDLDWAAAGVTAPGDPADPATRHPSAFRV